MSADGETDMTDYISRESVLKILSDKNAAWDAYQKVQSLPAADVVPMDFHERCLEIEIEKRLALEKSAVESTIAKGKLNLFARWVAKKVVDENFEMDAGAFAEVCCRKLRHLGIVTDDEDNWIFNPTNADNIRAMTDEELAHLLHSAEEHLFTGNLWNYEKWTEWLKQEASE